MDMEYVYKHTHTRVSTDSSPPSSQSFRPDRRALSNVPHMLPRKDLPGIVTTSTRYTYSFFSSHASSPFADHMHHPPNVISIFPPIPRCALSSLFLEPPALSLVGLRALVSS